MATRRVKEKLSITKATFYKAMQPDWDGDENCDDDDPYERWYLESSQSSDSSVSNAASKQQEQQQQQSEEEYYLRSLPCEEYPILKPLANMNTSTNNLRKREELERNACNSNKRQRQ